MDEKDWMILHELSEIKRRQSWLIDLSSNIAGNAIFDGAVWLFSKLIRRL